MSEARVFQYQYNHLPFVLGTLSDVTNYILSQAQKRNIVVLPCDLNSLATLSDGKRLGPTLGQDLDVVTTDGMPLVWWLKFKTGFKTTQRVYGPDLMKQVLVQTQNRAHAHFFYGSSTDTITKLQTNIKRFAPKTHIVGAISPPFVPLTDQEEEKYLKTIKESQADFLWLGISSPKQILLAARWKKKLPKTSIFCVGAAFDFIAETKPSAPPWMKSTGLEWLFRMLTEPNRLGKRYLTTIPSFLLKTGMRKIKNLLVNGT